MRYEIFFKYFFILLFPVLLSFELEAQKKSELEEQKRKTLQQLKLSRELLDQTRNKKRNSVHQINLLASQIEHRNTLIENYQAEIKEIETTQDATQNRIKENESVLRKLKEQYAKIIRNTYRNLEEDYVMMYILGSEDINQGYERIRYIKYLNQHRTTLYNQIVEKNDSMSLLNERLDSLKQKNQYALAQMNEEKEKLYRDRRQKQRSIEELKGKESELLAKIKEHEETQRNIENEIRRIIEEEAREAKLANKVYELTPEEKIISEDFINNKGGLPWPTLQGIVTGKFGEHPHPVVPGIKIQSNGIDLSTVENTEVRAIFKGEVTLVSAILGANYTVIIKHGNYRSVYQNLVNVRVKSGDNVETKEIIGNVGTNMDNETKLHFELWNGMDVVNPEYWLSK